MTQLSTLRINVLEAFKALKEALFALEAALDLDEELPAWFLPPQELSVNLAAKTRTQAHTLIRQLEYLDCQKPREILVGAGLIAASENTIQTIVQLNQCKDRFKEAMIALKKANIKINDSLLCEQFEPLLEKRIWEKQNHVSKDESYDSSNSDSSYLSNSLDKRPEAIATTLKRAGLARLHLKQCYRRIPIFLDRPIKVSWTWANTKAITRITVEQARQLLLKQGNDYSVELQLAKLQALPLQEPLAIVQELAPHLRANVVFSDERNNNQSSNNESRSGLERRVMVKGPIPLFYLAKENDAFPRIRPPGLKRGKNKERRIRSDVKLDPEAFLPSIRVHRYIN